MSDSGQLRQLTRTRLALFLREPEALFWVFLFPVVLTLVLSVAFKNRGIAAVQVGAVTGDLAPRWIEALEATPEIHLVRFGSLAEAEAKLRSGRLDALAAGQDSLTLRFDPTRPEGETARLRVDAAVQEAMGRADPVTVLEEPVTERGSRYIDFLIPGILGMNLMGTGIWGTGFNIVEMRQKKLLKLLMVTPMRKSHFLLAQMLSRFVFLVLEVVVITGFGVLLLGVPFRGSVLLFALVCALGALAFTGIGLLIASRAQTIEGISGLMNFVMMPMWLLSGVFFSYEKYPEVFHPAIRFLPLTALNDGLRAVMLEGDGVVSLLPEIGILGLCAVGCLAAALRIFRWQ
jgi:ABC-type polysaccharide/polyol phosphate export permease